MVRKGWFSDNIVAIIAVAFTLFTFTVDIILLSRQVKTSDSITITILTSINNAEMIILGYYFVSSKTNKEKDKTISDLMKDNADLNKTDSPQT